MINMEFPCAGFEVITSELGIWTHLQKFNVILESFLIILDRRPASDHAHHCWDVQSLADRRFLIAFGIDVANGPSELDDFAKEFF
jgi:hypothetical protein